MMMKNKLKCPSAFFILNLSIQILILAACSSPKIKMTANPNDSLRIHYHEGQKFLREGDLLQAEVQFRSALLRNDAFAPAFEGLAQVELQRGNWRQAERWANKAVQINDEWIPARVVRGRIHLASGAYAFAVEELSRALKIAEKYNHVREQASIYYWLGLAHEKTEEFEAARECFTIALKLQPGQSEAAKALVKLDEYYPLVVGRPAAIKGIAAKEYITRADLAVLLVGLLAGQNGQSASTPIVAVDVDQNLPAKKYIEHALQTGLLQLLPDSTFRPALAVTRAGFSVIVENILVKALSDPGLKQRFWRSSGSPFKDVLPVYPIFNAVLVVSSYKILESPQADFFFPQNSISGLEAIRAVENLKILLDSAKLSESKDR